MKDLTKLTSRQISQIKNIYKANSSIYSRIDTLRKHLDKIQEEYDEQVAIIEANEAGVKMLTGGYISKDLITDVQIPQFNEDGTPKMDKDGKYQLKKRVLTFVIPEQPANETPVEEENVGQYSSQDVLQKSEATESTGTVNEENIESFVNAETTSNW